MKRALSLILLVMTVLTGNAQNPFAAYGYQPKMATMSNGRYDECHDRSRIVEIGSVRFDTKTNKIVGIVNKDTTITDVEAQTVSRFISIDPHAERYYSISPYAYCKNNPIRLIDPDGQDGWDVVVGYGIGLLTNIIPGSGNLRDTYAPTDPSDYNNALQGIDNASILVGDGMVKIGGGGMAVGGGAVAVGVTATAASGGTLAIGGVPVAVVGGALIEAGATTATTGAVLMTNGKENKEAGYDRGKKNEVTFTQGTGNRGKKITTEIPNGYKKVKERTKNDMPIFRKGKNYISPDRDGHNGGIWKKANSIKDLNDKTTRSGTYDKDLNKIGE